MAKMVGLSRNLKLPWLNQIVQLVAEGLPDEEIKEELNHYLGFEIESPTVLRKTRDILMHVWVYENSYSQYFKETALNLINNYPEYALEIHWCMMLATYPVFVDLCSLIGKMIEFQDEITLSQIKQKLFDIWGERTTLYHSIDKQIATLKSFNVLTCDKPGKYHVTYHDVEKTEIACFMIYAIMNINQNSHYTLQEINSLVCLFPFKYRIKKQDLLQDCRFAMNNSGGDKIIALQM